MTAEEFGCGYGGGILGPVDALDTSLCSDATCGYSIIGFFDNREFVGEIPSSVPGAETGYSFPQWAWGYTSFQYEPSHPCWEDPESDCWIDVWLEAPWHSDGNLAGDSDSRHPNGVGNTDVNKVFGRDTPGTITLDPSCENSKNSYLYYRYVKNLAFKTEVHYTYKGMTLQISSVLQWYQQMKLETDANGEWTRVPWDAW